jgi:hypothetical protein
MQHMEEQRLLDVIIKFTPPAFVARKIQLFLTPVSHRTELAESVAFKKKQLETSNRIGKRSGVSDAKAKS